MENGEEEEVDLRFFVKQVLQNQVELMKMVVQNRTLIRDTNQNFQNALDRNGEIMRASEVGIQSIQDKIQENVSFLSRLENRRSNSSNLTGKKRKRNLEEAEDEVVEKEPKKRKLESKKADEEKEEKTGEIDNKEVEGGEDEEDEALTQDSQELTRPNNVPPTTNPVGTNGGTKPGKEVIDLTLDDFNDEDFDEEDEDDDDDDDDTQIEKDKQAKSTNPSKEVPPPPIEKENIPPKTVSTPPRGRSSSLSKFFTPTPMEKFPHKAQEVVRNKLERSKMEGGECAECKEFYELVSKTNPLMNQKQLMNHCSRHRHRKGNSPPKQHTPPGYWNLDFFPSQ